MATVWANMTQEGGDGIKKQLLCDEHELMVRGGDERKGHCVTT